jgi:hypothetical protein
VITKVLWTSVPRMPGETDWEHSALVHETGSLTAIYEELRRHAAQNHLILESLTPSVGWLYKLPSGREIPCGEHSQGARPVWIWRATA